jgi:UDP-glucose 4-epimerase
MRSKVTVVGAGNVGASCAQLLAQRDYAEVVLVDIIEGMPQGKSLDLRQAGPIRYYDTNIIGTNNYADTADYGEWRFGRRATGLVFSAATSAQKLGWTIGGSIAAYILALYGYQANVPQRRKHCTASGS